MSLCYFSLLAGSTDCKGAQEPFQSLLRNSCSVLTNPLFYHSQLSISPFPMKIRWFYFWYSVYSSSLGRCLPRPTTFMSFLPELDLSGGVLTTAWQTNRKRFSHRIMALFHICFYKKGLAAPYNTVQRRCCLKDLHRYSVCCALEDSKLLFHNKSGICVRCWNLLSFEDQSSLLEDYTAPQWQWEITALGKGINSLQTALYSFTRKTRPFWPTLYFSAKRFIFYH